MKVLKHNFIRVFGFILFLGLCIAMVKGTEAKAAEGEPRLNVKTVSIIKDGTYRLRVYNLSEGQTVSYRSSDKTIAKVSSSGKIKGLAIGTAVITVTVKEEDIPISTLQCEVTIGPAAVSVKFTKAELVMQVDSTKTLKTVVLPANTVESPVFYSQNTTIAAISSVGRVRAKEVGTVQIFAFLSNGQSTICEVTVLSAEDYAYYEEGIPLDMIADVRALEEAAAAAAEDEGQDTGKTGEDVQPGEEGGRTDEGSIAEPTPAVSEQNTTSGSAVSAESYRSISVVTD